MSMAEAFEAVGVTREQIAFQTAVARFQNNGGSYEQAKDVLDAAYGMLGEGQENPADKANRDAPSARQQNGDAGRKSCADEAIRTLPASPTKGDGKGRLGIAAEGHRHDARPSPTSPTAAEIRAMSKARKGAAVVVLEHFGWLANANIPGGPRYIDIRVGDLPGMIERQVKEGATHARSAAVLGMIASELEKAGKADDQQLWIDVLPKAIIGRIAKATETENIVPMAVGWLRGFSNRAQQVIEGKADVA